VLFILTSINIKIFRIRPVDQRRCQAINRKVSTKCAISLS